MTIYKYSSHGNRYIIAACECKLLYSNYECVQVSSSWLSYPGSVPFSDFTYHCNTWHIRVRYHMHLRIDH